MNSQLNEAVPSSIVYHYTSASGLHGIVTSKSICATNILYLNDSSELIYAAQMLQKVIDELLKDTRDASNKGLLFKVYERASFLHLLPTSVYVCSFTLQGNLLSQWRGYCPDGSGFSVGFDPSKLAQLAKAQGLNWV